MESTLRFAIPLILLLLSAVGCRQDGEGKDAESTARAQRLAQELLIVDTHIDVPYRLREKMEDVGVETSSGDFDFPRARRGGLDVAFMSIYVPASKQDTGEARPYADELIDLVEGIVARHPDRFALAASVDEARRRVAEGRLVLAMGMENGAPIEDDLDNLRHFHDRGIRYITLAHSKSNQISDSSYDENRRWGGLSPFGKQVVAEMNRLGIMIDVSHITDDAFHQVLETSRAPVIASHSSCRHFTPGWERNMSDAMIRELAAKGGVIQINFGSSFLDDEYRRRWEERQDSIDRYLEEHAMDGESDEGRSYARSYRDSHPIEVADVSDVADHIDHVVQLVGIDYVGLGSDFDGVGESTPTGLRDVSQYPNLIAELLARGYGEEEIAKVCGGNLLRVWSEVERIAGGR